MAAISYWIEQLATVGARSLGYTLPSNIASSPDNSMGIGTPVIDPYLPDNLMEVQLTLRPEDPHDGHMVSASFLVSV
jgi:hypothetical protein